MNLKLPQFCVVTTAELRLYAEWQHRFRLERSWKKEKSCAIDESQEKRQREQDSPVSHLAAASCSVSKSLHCEETSFVGAVSGGLTTV